MGGRGAVMKVLSSEIELGTIAFLHIDTDF